MACCRTPGLQSGAGPILAAVISWLEPLSFQGTTITAPTLILSVWDVLGGNKPECHFLHTAAPPKRQKDMTGVSCDHPMASGLAPIPAASAVTDAPAGIQLG